MDTQNNTMRNVVIMVLIIAGLGAGYWYMSGAGNPLPLASGDSVASWNFQGSHDDDGPNEQKVRDEIARLEAGLKDEAAEPTDYALYVSIANQYSLLGDGKAVYNYLGKALAIDSEKTGLAWHNMGVLMERLGAYNTARIAFERASLAQPVVETYHTAYLQFLLKHFPDDPVSIESGLQKMEDTFGGEYPALLQIKAEWLTMQGKTKEAAEVSEQLTAQLGIDAEIQTSKIVE